MKRVGFFLRCLCLGLGVMLADPGLALEGRWVTFLPHDGDSPYDGGAQLPVDAGVIRGLLVQPDGEGPFPAVVMAHDCRGLLPYQVGWAERFAEWGYMVLLVDSFFTRHVGSVCTGPQRTQAAMTVSLRVRDLYGAYDYLGALTAVDAGRVSLVGWDTDLTLAALGEAAGKAHPERRFQAAIAFYPDCRKAIDKSYDLPLLILTGARDDWTPPRYCTRLALKTAGSRVSLRTYEFAGHGFDDTALQKPLSLLVGPDGMAEKHMVNLAWSRSAHKKSLTDVMAFLERNFRSSRDKKDFLPVMPVEGAAHWVQRPQDFGSRYPRRGRSLFDQFFSKGLDSGAVEYDIPFPFELLQQRLKDYLQPVFDNRPVLTTVLLPFGRSLQRVVASHEHPRALLAVDADSRLTDGNNRLMLKNRLFIAYVEKVNMLEVISYNEALGRFEFQVVHNYRKNTRPEVEYARREVCMACHQNAAPLFSAAPWDESNSNRDVAARLASVRPVFYGISSMGPGPNAAAYDNATDRANLLSTWNLLWQSGCGNDRAGLQCRRAVLQAMLQYRLSQFTDFDRHDPAFRRQLLEQQQRNWARNWPDGLAIPNGDIANRNPTLSADVREISARLDPIRRRVPQRVWQTADENNMAAFIQGLASDLSRQEVRQLDRRLMEQHRVGQPHRLRFSCIVEESRRPGSVTWLDISCIDPENPGDTTLRMHLHGRNGQLQGNIRWFRLPQFLALSRLTVTEARLGNMQGMRHLQIDGLRSRGDLQPRLPDGRRFQQMTIRWSGTGPVSGMQKYPASLDLEFVDDFIQMRAALDRMLARAIADPDHPLHMRTAYTPALMQDLFRELGMEPAPWCCDKKPVVLPALPNPEKETVRIIGAGTERALLQVLQRHCASCHRGDQPFPPNFLAGNAAQVVEKVRHCAPRMLYRLMMWKRHPDERAKTPMPPFGSVVETVSADRAWPQTADYLMLTGRLEKFVEKHIAATVNELLQLPYREFRSCLPSSQDGG